MNSIPAYSFILDEKLGNKFLVDTLMLSTCALLSTEWFRSATRFCYKSDASSEIPTQICPSYCYNNSAQLERLLYCFLDSGLGDWNLKHYLIIPHVISAFLGMDYNIKRKGSDALEVTFCQKKVMVFVLKIFIKLNLICNSR